MSKQLPQKLEQALADFMAAEFEMLSRYKTLADKRTKPARAAKEEKAISELRSRQKSVAPFICDTIDKKGLDWNIITPLPPEPKGFSRSPLFFSIKVASVAATKQKSGSVKKDTPRHQHTWRQSYETKKDNCVAIVNTPSLSALVRKYHPTISLEIK